VYNGISAQQTIFNIIASLSIIAIVSIITIIAEVQ